MAAQGQGFQVVIGGKTQSIGGTSASAPVRKFINSVRTIWAYANYLKDFRRCHLAPERLPYLEWQKSLGLFKSLLVL